VIWHLAIEYPHDFITMQRPSWLGARAFLIVSAALASFARAETPNSVVRAEGLFQTGRQLMREGRYAEACPKLEESQKLDPAPGTRLNLADCWEHAGRTASAQREFTEVAQVAERNGESERAAIARARARQLESKLIRLLILVPAQARVPGLEVLRNSVVVPEMDWNSARGVDPGRFVIEARAPGRQPYRRELALNGGAAATHDVTIPILSPLESGAPSPGPADPPSRQAQWLQGSGIGLLGLGAVGVTLGTVFGLRAVSLYHRSQAEGCNERDVCTAEALETRHSALRSGNVSTVSFVVGGVLLAGGAGLYVWGSRERDAAQGTTNARLVPTPGGGFVAISSQF
jgi:hypothetical protein